MATVSCCRIFSNVNNSTYALSIWFIVSLNDFTKPCALDYKLNKKLKKKKSLKTIKTIKLPGNHQVKFSSFVPTLQLFSLLYPYVLD